MALTQGDVRITIGVTGKGDTKVIKDTKKEVEGLGEKIGTSMKSSVGPLDKVRSGFELMRSNAMFLTGAVVGVVGGIAALVGALSENMQSIHAWRDATKEIEGAIDSAREAYERLQVSLGNRPENKMADGIEAATKKWESMAGPIDLAAGAVNALSDEIKMLKEQEAYNPFAKGLIDAQDATGRLTTELSRAMNHLNGLETERRNLALEIGDAMRSQVGTMREIVGVSSDIARAQGMLPQPFFKRWPVGQSGGGGRGGGGSRKPSAAEIEDLLGGTTNADSLNDVWAAFTNATSGGSPAGGGSASADQMGSGARGKSNMQMLAGDVRDFTAALSESLPGMDAFTGALSQISSMWGEYAETGKGAARATIMSVGAIAMAGAEQIKNERLRAGVLSIIHLGLGTALMFVPGAQQEAFGHLAGAAILGGVAIFGGGGGGGGSKRSEPTRSFNRSLSDRTTSGNASVVINTGVYFAGLSGQETAAEMHSMSRRGNGSGFVPARG